MPRKSNQYATTASSFRSTSHVPHTNSSSSEALSLHNPYTLLQDGVPHKTPQQNHNQTPSSGHGSTRGANKGSGGGKKKLNATDGETDDSDSSIEQDDEDAEEDDEEPAVNRPVRVKEHVHVKPFSKEEYSRDSEVLDGDGIATKISTHRTGQNSKKRSHRTALQDNTDFSDIDALFFDKVGGKDTQNDEDEPDYPRKKVAKSLSHSNGLLTYETSRPNLTDASDILDDDEFERAIIDDDDESNIEDEEEEAIIRDLEKSGGFSTPVKATSDTNSVVPDLHGIDFDLLEGEVFDDLDNEAFLAEWNDPARFADLNSVFPTDFDPFADLAGQEDLFSVNPSPAYTPIDTPNATPRGSFSATAEAHGSPTPRMRRNSAVSQSSNADDESEDEKVAEVGLFESADPVPKNIVSMKSSANKWSNDTDEDNEVWKHFFSSGEETSDEDECETDSEKGSDEESETGEGETTEEEEDLPMPTPRSKSILRHASISSSVGSARPQIVRIDDSNSSGPTLGSWVADPSRPICVIDGHKKTFILPGGEKTFSIAESDSSAFTNGLYVISESDSEYSADPSGYNPTLGGLTGGEGHFLNGSDILGPPEAFYPYVEYEARLDKSISNLDAEDGMDEFEADLQLDDFLDFSNDEGVEKGDEAEGNRDISATVAFDGVSDALDGEEENVRDGESSDAMLSRWEKVSVTAFRKRQIQHSQKMTQHNSQNYSGPTPGAHKNRDGRLSETITPGRKRRLKQKFMAGGGQATNSSTAIMKKVAAKRGEELGWNPGPTNKWAPLFESL